MIYIVGSEKKPIDRTKVHMLRILIYKSRVNVQIEIK